MKRYLYTIIICLFTLSVQAQQWVWHEIAEEQSESESVPTWLIYLTLIIGFVIYRYIRNKDAEEEEKIAQNRRIEEQQRIEELASLIKQFGMLDPILVRPKDEKYEIVMGMDKYKAALLANLTSIPVIIKEVTDEVYTKYQNVDSIQDVSLITRSKETFSKKEENLDVVNLDELSKIKLEYERDDVKMNNGQFNTENNNLGAINNKPAPTFGGSFFPSLEDEPTNMNMMG